MLRQLMSKISQKSISAEIPNGYLLSVSKKYFGDFVRGTIICVGINRKGNLYVGKKTKIMMKRLVNTGKSVRIGDYSYIDGLSKKGIKIGNYSKLGNHTVIRCSGIENVCVGGGTSWE